jgi:hypothetical protein
MRFKHFAVVSAALAFAGAAHAAVINDFDSAGDTAGATTDRYTPATFQSGVAYGGHAGTLEVGVSAADGANNRPAAYADGFYNTQGEGFDLSPAVTSLSAEIYIDPTYAGLDDGTRIGGLWGFGYDNTDTLADYPIIELGVFDGSLQFRGWDSTGLGSWTNLGVSSSFGSGSWSTVTMKLGSSISYYVDGEFLGSVASGGSTSIQRAVFQGYNTTNGVNLSSHWDNLSGSVPEPSTWALMILGFGGAGAVIRRRRHAAA